MLVQLRCEFKNDKGVFSLFEDIFMYVQKCAGIKNVEKNEELEQHKS